MAQDGTSTTEYADVVARLKDIGLLDEPELFAETVDLFLTDATAVVAQLKEAFATGDALALERAAHRVKGAALNLGVSSIALPAKALEDEARRDVFAGAPANIRTLEVELSKVSDFLRAEVVRVSSRQAG
jgi:HPt (histidine-containing phosphotransfer) domain-containing protein